MKPKLVSVIIPNYNYGKYLPKAIDSVLSQTYSNLEVVVVNNGSTDDSLEVLMGYEGKVKLVDQSNHGQSGARNSGLKHAKGDYLAFLDADDYWHPTKIEKQVSLLSSDVELVYCGISIFLESENRLVSLQYPQYHGECSQNFVTKPGVSIVLSGESTAIFTRNLLEKVGIFDAELNSAAGWDFFRRCSKYTEFDFVAEPLTYYRVHDSNMSNSSKNNISDSRKAYKKLLSDDQWKLSSNSKQKLLRALEITYLKTQLKEFNFKDSFFSILSILKLYLP
jgi:glycosyltransferase involved in cell wall biosynthesis